VESERTKARPLERILVGFAEHGAVDWQARLAGDGEVVLVREAVALA
jgi:hypothetical protein